MHVAKTKALISFAVTAMLICALVFTQAFRWFSHAVAQLYLATRKSVFFFLFFFFVFFLFFVVVFFFQEINSYEFSCKCSLKIIWYMGG